GMYVAADVVFAVYAVHGAVLAFVLQSLAIHHKEACVSFNGLWQVFLRNYVTVEADGLHNLVEVGRIVLLHHKNARPTRALQWLQDDVVFLLVKKLLYLLLVAGDERAGAHRFWKVLE